MSGAELSLRSAEPGDLDAIAAIEAACFPRPWTRVMFAEELARAFARVAVAVSDSDNTLLGFACVWHLPPEAHLLKIATATAARRRGVGGALLRHSLQGARAAGCEQVQLEVASANTNAVRLYERAGFAVVGRRPGYYREPPDDALLMTCRREWMGDLLPSRAGL